MPKVGDQQICETCKEPLVWFRPRGGTDLDARWVHFAPRGVLHAPKVPAEVKP